MGNNCLVTKLKGSVQNNTLPRLGAWVITRENPVPAGWSYADDKIYIHGDAGVVAKIYSDDVTEIINTSSGATLSLPAELAISVGSSYMRQFTFSQVGTVYVESKYKIDNIELAAGESTGLKMTGTLDDYTYKDNPERVTRLNFRGMKLDGGDIASLSRLPNLTSVDLLRQANVFGDVEDISILTSLTTLNLQDCPMIKGTASDLGVFVSATILAILRTGITGSVEDLVSSQVSHGRTTVTSSSPLYSNVVLAQLKFGGIIRPTSEGPKTNGIITWESASKIAVYTNGESIAASTHVFCKGYTQQEAESVFSGKTIIRVDA